MLRRMMVLKGERAPRDCIVVKEERAPWDCIVVLAFVVE